MTDRHSDDNGVSYQEYINARIEDMQTKHRDDIAALQAEMDRRFRSESDEMNLRFEQVTARINNNDKDRQNLHDHLDRVDASLERQKGRMSVYAGITSIVIIIIAIAGLFLDHVL